MVAREARRELHAPRRRRHQVHALLELLHERVGRAVQKRHQLAAAGLGHARRLALAARRPLVDRDAGDGEDVVARLRRQRAPPRQELAQPSRPGIVGAAARPRLPNWSASSRRNSADFGSACTGSNGSSRPRSAAVRGMNWAMPWARSPLLVRGPTTSAWKRLSCQITRAKNSSGRFCARAALSIMRQSDSRTSTFPARAGGGVAGGASVVADGGVSVVAGGGVSVAVDGGGAGVSVRSLSPPATELGFTRVRSLSAAEVGYIRLRLRGLG